MSSFRTLIERFAKIDAYAAAAGVTVEQARVHKTRGVIPSEYWEDLLQAAPGFVVTIVQGELEKAEIALATERKRRKQQPELDLTGAGS